MKVLIISQSIHSSVHLPFDPKKERWSPVVGCYLTCPGPQSSTPTSQPPRTVGAGKGLRTLESTQCCHGMAGAGAAHDELLILSFPRLCPMHLRYMPLTALTLQQWMRANVIPRRMCRTARLALLCLCHPMRTAGTASAMTTMVPQ